MILKHEVNFYSLQLQYSCHKKAIAVETSRSAPMLHNHKTNELQQFELEYSYF